MSQQAENGGTFPARVTVVGSRCRSCGSVRVKSTYVPISSTVIRECAGCETRRGSYQVKSTPKWVNVFPTEKSD